MSSEPPSWADQWGSSGVDSYDDGGNKHSTNNKKGKKTAKVKAAASVGLGKAKVAATIGAQKVKNGTAVGISVPSTPSSSTDNLLAAEP